MPRFATVFFLCSLWASSLSAAWFPSPPDTTVDFTSDELALLDTEFHRHFDADFLPLGGAFEVRFFKSIPSYLSFATMKGDIHHVGIMGGNLSKTHMTMDSLRMLICHELGHFLGGGPRRIALDPQEDQEWNVIEGAADYYATLQCMKRILKGQDHSEALLAAAALPASAIERCQANFGQSEDQSICQRTLLASQQLIAFFAHIKKVPNSTSLDLRDPAIVDHTYPAHPDLQCRLDTYAAGATCNRDPEVPLDPKDLSQGTCSDRPLCWFYPADFETAAMSP